MKTKNHLLEVSGRAACGAEPRQRECWRWAGRGAPAFLRGGARRLCQLKSFCSRWQQLNKDFAEFQKKIEDVDRRLAALLCQGFDDCNSLASAMKVRVCPSASVLSPGTEPAAQHAAPHLGATVGASPRRPGDTRGTGASASVPGSWCTCLPSSWSGP